MPRAKGSLNKATIIKRQALQSAFEVCQDMNISPPQIMAEAINVIRRIALSPLASARTAEEQAALFNSLPNDRREQIVRFLKTACDIDRDLMDFAYPRLARIEHTGADGGPIEHEHGISDPEQYVLSRLARLAEREHPKKDNEELQ